MKDEIGTFGDPGRKREPLKNQGANPAKPGIAPIDRKQELPGLAKAKPCPSLLSRHIKAAHKRAARVLGLALTLDNSTGWQSASAIWQARLTEGERGALLMAALCSVQPEFAFLIIDKTFPGAGEPSLAPWAEPLDEAQAWADYANPGELRAYALAAFMAMPRRDQLDFIEYTRGVTA